MSQFPDSTQHDSTEGSGGPRQPMGAPGALPPAPSSYPPAYGYVPPPPPRRGGSWLGRFVSGIVASILLLSLTLNFYFGLIVFNLTSGPAEVPWRDGDQSRRIVILPVAGVIDESTSEFMRRALASLREMNHRPAAIVLRVNSPGGGVAASDRIWHDLLEFKNDTGVPIVASFGSVAASGGYYVAAAADYIVAEPTGLTGSIGVIAQAFTVAELMQKIGVKPEIVVARDSHKKDSLSPFRTWTEQDRATMQNILDAAYDRFVEVVHEGRRSTMDEAAVREVATGEVYTIQQAIDFKLVDEAGFLEDAIAKAAALGGVPSGVEPAVTMMQRPSSFGLLSLKQSVPSGALSANAEEVRTWLADLTTPHLEYRMVLPGQ